jgi:hypothetical protein
MKTGCLLTIAICVNCFSWPQIALSQDDATKTKQHQLDRDKRVTPPAHVIIDPPFPLAMPKPEPIKTQNESKDKPLMWFIKSEWVIVYVTAIYALIAWLTLKAIKRQGNLMERQAEEARESTTKSISIAAQAANAATKAVEVSGAQLRQVESQTRPWIGLDTDVGIQTGPLFVDNEGNVTTTINITARNYGSYPGQKVFCAARLVVTSDLNDVFAEESRIPAESIPENAGSVVFPGPSRVKWQWPSTARKGDSPGARDELLAFIVGCIWYRDQFGGKHHTVFSYHLKQPGTIRGVVFKRFPGISVSGNWTDLHGFVDRPDGPSQT